MKILLWQEEHGWLWQVSCGDVQRNWGYAPTLGEAMKAAQKEAEAGG